MQFNDNAMPNEESISNMSKSYAKLGLNKTVSTLSDKRGVNPKLFSLFKREIDLLKILSNRSQNISIKDYFVALTDKSQQELDRITKDFSENDNTLSENPIFFNKLNATNNFKTFLETDLDLIDVLGESLTGVLKDEDKKFLFGVLNRHIDALKELFKIMHLITFY